MKSERIMRLKLTTRGYEVSSRGYIAAGTWLRYLEHHRWQTFSADAPLPVRRFWTMGVVRAQALELFEQVSFHETLDFAMWIGRVGRTSLDFAHEVIRPSDGKTLALATATIVALDADRRPKEIDSAARALIVSGRLPTVERPTRARPESPWSQSIALRLSDHDLQQHVNQSRYADFFDDARLVGSAAGAYGPGKWNEPIRRLSIEYEREAVFGEPAILRSWKVDGTTSDIEFELCHESGAVLTRGRADVNQDGP